MAYIHVFVISDWATCGYDYHNCLTMHIVYRVRWKIKSPLMYAKEIGFLRNKIRDNILLSLSFVLHVASTSVDVVMLKRKVKYVII